MPELYNTQKLMFSDALPIGTTIVLTNIRTGEAPTYWYYKIETTGQTVINLNVFKKQGTTSGVNYTKSTADNNLNEQFIVAVDFGNCTSYISRGTHTIKLKFEGEGGREANFESLEFITTAKRNITFTTSTTATNVNTDFTASYTLGAITGVETKYLAKKMALIIKAPATLPLDSYILVNSKKYSMNGSREFIIGLNEIETGSRSVTMRLVSNMLPKTQTNYDLGIELWASSTANGEQPKEGEKIAEKQITISTVAVPQPALKVTAMANRLMEISNVQDNNTVTINYKKVTNCTATVELQKKVGSGYQKVTDVLNEVNGITTHNMGVYTLNPSNGTNTISFSLSSITPTGTYRLVFKVNDNNGNNILEAPYNFMVIE